MTQLLLRGALGPILALLLSVSAPSAQSDSALNGYLNTLRTTCSNAYTRNEKGTCILQSIIYTSGRLSIRNYNGQVLPALLPRSRLVPNSNDCRYILSEVRHDMSAMAYDFFISSRGRRQEFMDIELTCRSVEFLRMQLFGSTLHLDACLPDTDGYEAILACLTQMIEVYSPDALAEMQAAAEATFMEYTGTVPAVISDAFSGDIRGEIVAALEEDQVYCLGNAQRLAAGTTSIQADGAAIGGVLFNTIYSQLSGDVIDHLNLDGYEIQGRVSCTDVMRLLGQFTGQGDTLLTAYLEAQSAARQYQCDPSRIDEGPADEVLTVALNDHLISRCSAEGFLSFWVQDMWEGRDPQGNPFSLAAVEFSNRGNLCRMQSRITTFFAQPEVTFRLVNAVALSRTQQRPGQFQIDVTAQLSCNINDPRPLAQELFCGAFSAAPAQMSLVATWSESECEWRMSDIQSR